MIMGPIIMIMLVIAVVKMTVMMMMMMMMRQPAVLPHFPPPYLLKLQNLMRANGMLFVSYVCTTVACNFCSLNKAQKTVKNFTVFSFFGINRNGKILFPLFESVCVCVHVLVCLFLSALYYVSAFGHCMF